MKIHIEATQEEFDAKRPELIKALAGKHLDVAVKPMPKEPYYRSQAELIDNWDREYSSTIRAIKKEISDVVGD